MNELLVLADIFKDIGMQVENLSPEIRYEISYPRYGAIDIDFYDANGERHCDNGPASIRVNTEYAFVSSEAWYCHGKSHRVDGPAIIDRMYDDDTNTVHVRSVLWMQNNDAHREDGPAELTYRLCDDGTMQLTCEEWQQHGTYHRTDGPAYITYDYLAEQLWPSLEIWYDHDTIHRVDGPASTRYTNYLMLGKRDFVIAMPVQREWYQYDRLHRTDGPAVINFNNRGIWHREWYLNGARHREDGPAELKVVQVGKRRWIDKFYYIDGVLHNTNMPNVMHVCMSSEKSRMYRRYTYYHDSDLHNIMGPAVKCEYYGKNGKITRTLREYWLKGTQVDDRAQLAALLTHNTNLMLQDQQDMHLAV